MPALKTNHKINYRLLFSLFSFLVLSALLIFNIVPTTHVVFAYSVPPKPDLTDCTNQPYSCFVTKYGFNPNPASYSYNQTQLNRMAQIKPYAIKAAQVYNSIPGHDKVEPEMIVWWPVYDTGGVINYSNCANNPFGETPRGYTYNSWMSNCDRADFWQLGWGAQFNHVRDLLEGFP